MAQKRRQSKDKKTSMNADLSTSKQTSGIATEQRQNMIAEAAYLIAEKRSFQGDAALDDWLQAESEVKVQLGFTE